MFQLMILLFVVALVAGALGFSGISGAAMGGAKILFFVMLIGAVLILVLGLAGIVAVF